MLHLILPAFTPRPLQTILTEELYTTERELLEAISAEENWKSRVQLLENRSRRLRDMIATHPEVTPPSTDTVVFKARITILGAFCAIFFATVVLYGIFRPVMA